MDDVVHVEVQPKEKLVHMDLYVFPSTKIKANRLAERLNMNRSEHYREFVAAEYRKYFSDGAQANVS